MLYDRPESGGRCRVLVVEDEALVALDLEATLEAAGFKVVGAAPSCSTAIEAAERLIPDIALMDVHLAGRGDGIQAATSLWRSLGIRSVFLTGHFDGELKRRGAMAEPLGWLTKPLAIGDLFTVIADVRAGRGFRQTPSFSLKGEDRAEVAPAGAKPSAQEA